MAINGINNGESGSSVRNKLNQTINIVNLGVTTSAELDGTTLKFNKNNQNNAYNVDLSGLTITQPNGVKTTQVTITESEILDPLGFSKIILDSVTGKILIPLSLSVYRKSGGTNYSLSNSIRLNGVIGSSSATIGNTIDAAFTNSTEGSLILSYNINTLNTTLIPGNSLWLISGSFSSPSVVTGGTGDCVVYLTYIEIDSN
jgi:hypothetical protein